MELKRIFEKEKEGAPPTTNVTELNLKSRVKPRLANLPPNPDQSMEDLGELQPLSQTKEAIIYQQLKSSSIQKIHPQLDYQKPNRAFLGKAASQEEAPQQSMIPPDKKLLVLLTNSTHSTSKKKLLTDDNKKTSSTSMIVSSTSSSTSQEPRLGIICIHSPVNDGSLLRLHY
eukprot:jgi/Psemu1/32289/gm1.32289_g